MGILDNINARFNAQKEEKALQLLSPLERIGLVIKADIETSNTVLIQKDWAAWDAKKKGDFHEKNATKQKDLMDKHIQLGKNFRGLGNPHQEIAKFHEESAIHHGKASYAVMVGNNSDAEHHAEQAKACSTHADNLKASFKEKTKKEELVQKDWAAWNAKEKAAGNNWGHKKVIHEYGAKVRGLGSPTENFNHYVGDSSGNLKKVTANQYHEASLPDRTPEATKAGHIQHLASKIKQFNHKVEFNSWLKASPRTHEDKISKLKTYGVK